MCVRVLACVRACVCACVCVSTLLVTLDGTTGNATMDLISLAHRFLLSFE